MIQYLLLIKIIKARVQKENKNMKVINNKKSRASFRKAIKQISEPLYLQRMLIKKQKSNDSELEKCFDGHMGAYNYETKQGFNSIRKYLENITNKQEQKEYESDTEREKSKQKIIQENGKEIIVMQIQQNTEQKAEEIIDYFASFLKKNKQKMAQNKVERERLNIQYENYKQVLKILNRCLQQKTKQVLAYMESLQKQYETYRNYLAKLADEQKINALTGEEIEKIKQEQQKLERKTNKQLKNIQKLTYCKVDYVASVLKNGFYQLDGLNWLLKEIVNVEDEENTRWGLLNEMTKILGLRDNSIKTNIKELSVHNFPKQLDLKSKQYLLSQYQDLKKQQSIEIAPQVIEKQQITNKSSYILDPSSSIFPHRSPKNAQNFANSPLNISQSQIPGSSIPTFLFSRSNDSILTRSNITDLYKNLQIHNGNQKYNYDIKCIYANTRDSLLKWIKGKCKYVKQEAREGNSAIKSSNRYDNQDSRNEINQTELSNVKVNTQISIEDSIKEEDIIYTRIGSFVDSPIRNSHPITKEKKAMNQQQKQKQKKEIKHKSKQKKEIDGLGRQQGCSLPMIMKKKQVIPNFEKQSPKWVKTPNRSLIKPISNSIEVVSWGRQKEAKNPEQIKLFKSPQSMKPSKNAQQRKPPSPAKKDDKILILQEKPKEIKQKTKELKEKPKQLKQKIRILRIYPKEEQECVLKLMFGINAKREQLIHYLYV